MATYLVLFHPSTDAAPAAQQLRTLLPFRFPDHQFRFGVTLDNRLDYSVRKVGTVGGMPADTVVRRGISTLLGLRRDAVFALDPPN